MVSSLRTGSLPDANAAGSVSGHYLPLDHCLQVAEQLASETRLSFGASPVVWPLTGDERIIDLPAFPPNSLGWRILISSGPASVQKPPALFCWTVTPSERTLTLPALRLFPLNPLCGGHSKVSRACNAGGRLPRVLRLTQNFRCWRPHQAIIQSQLGCVSLGPPKTRS